jgi:ABC-type phosphate/phosphonate transport system ATPase subunit
MIRLNNVSLMRGVKPLLEQADLTLNPGDKIGLIGANGAGKSSLFAMLRRRKPRHWSAPRLITPSMATSTCASWKRNWNACKAHRSPRKTALPWARCTARWPMPMPTPCNRAPNSC